MQPMPDHQFTVHVLLPLFSILSCTTTQLCTLTLVVSLSLVGCYFQINSALFLVAWSIFFSLNFNGTVYLFEAMIMFSLMAKTDLTTVKT